MKYLAIGIVLLLLNGCATSFFGSGEDNVYQNTNSFNSKIKIQ